MSNPNRYANAPSRAQNRAKIAHEAGVLLLLLARAYKLIEAKALVNLKEGHVETLGAQLYNEGELEYKPLSNYIKIATLIVGKIPKNLSRELNLEDIAHMLLSVNHPRKKSSQKETADENQKDR